MSLAAAIHPGESVSKPGTACAACGLPARHRITVKAPHWTFPEDRDVCDECRRTFLAQIGDAKKPSTLITKITHQPAEVPPVPAPMPSVGSPPPISSGREALQARRLHRRATEPRALPDALRPSPTRGQRRRARRPTEGDRARVEDEGRTDTNTEGGAHA